MVTCNACGTLYHRKKTDQKYCTRQCSRVASVKTHSPKSRALMSKKVRKSYVKGRLQPRAIKVIYDGVHLDSSWELALAERLDEMRIPWIRGEQIQWTDGNGVARTYFPDFYLPEVDVYLEPKAPWTLKRKQTGREQEKVEYIKKHHPNVVFLWSKASCEKFSFV